MSEHTHSFEVERPAGKESEGVCSCGERRIFLNYIDESVWKNQAEGRFIGKRERRGRYSENQERRLPNDDWRGHGFRSTHNDRSGGVYD